MSRWKVIPWLLGTAVLAFTLVAARLNTPTPSANGDKATVSGPADAAGPTVIGTVGTLPEVFPLYPPAVPGTASLVVKKLIAREGPVAPGDVLIEFDPGPFVHQKEEAEQAVLAAEWTADQARRRFDEHPRDVEKAKLGVAKAEGDLAAAERAHKQVKDTLEDYLNLPDAGNGGKPLTPEQKELRRSRSPELLKAEDAIRQARQAVELAKLVQREAEGSLDLRRADMERANAQVAAAKWRVAAAKTVIEGCSLKAQVAGTVEQIMVGEGMAVGPATRTPLMYLVPAGPRVVRAEVEAEFAHKIDSFVEKTVTIRAGANFADTYTGTVKRVSTAFLPKRFGGDALMGGGTRALECVIEVTDPSPVGKSPLRPGQPVRVKFGQ
ncbi:MAG: hypothetical protein MUF18_19365 [Fimbriiglobus sp.]|jgi:multidrug resistance efflux pump|nr:hypothetical protein [Fimbriiglobus sp.]